MKIADIRAKGKDELKELVLASKKELFNLRMQASTGQLEKQSRFKEVRRTIARADLADCNTRHHVISSRLNAGAYDVRVFAPASPGDGFEPAEVALDDIYFLALKAG